MKTEQLRELVARAARPLPAAPPLTAFAAPSPTEGLECDPFVETLNEMPRLFRKNGDGTLAAVLDARFGLRIYRTISRRVATFAAWYEGKTQAQRKPDTTGGRWETYLRYAKEDLSIASDDPSRTLLYSLPEDRWQAMAKILEALGVEEDEWEAYIRKHLLGYHGWAAHMKTLQSEGETNALVEHLLMRLFYEYRYCLPVVKKLLGVDAKPWAAVRALPQRQPNNLVEGYFTRAFAAFGRRFPVLTKPRAAAVRALKKLLSDEPSTDTELIRISDLEEAEMRYQNRLFVQVREAFREQLACGLTSRSEGPFVHLSGGPLAKDRSALVRNGRLGAQIVFCIDPRSAAIRDWLEKKGYRTIGFAGFFGIAKKVVNLGSAEAHDECPVIVTPDKTVYERAPAGRNLTRYLGGQAAVATGLALKKGLKCDNAAAPSLVSITGLWYAPKLFGRIFFPSSYELVSEWLKTQVTGPKPETYFDISEFSPDEKGALAASIIPKMGLLRDLSDVVVLCAHGSTTFAQLHGLAYNCGACAGHRGHSSSKVAVAVLNDPYVRKEYLPPLGIVIPDHVRFVSAEHDTIDDTVVIDEPANLTKRQREIIAQLRLDFEEAGAKVRAERMKTLPQSVLPWKNKARTRGRNWSELRPEWGLANCASFLALPWLPEGLEGRTFHQNYNPELDPTGEVLEFIVTAPLVVAYTILMGYFWASAFPRIYSAGDKALHNAVGDFGVMEGSISDLKIGLPRQSVMRDSKTRMHEPLRMTAVIMAETAAIDRILNKHAYPASLVYNGWMHLFAMAPDGTLKKAIRQGEWLEVYSTVRAA